MQNTISQEQAIKSFLREYLNAEKGGHTVNNILSRACGLYEADRACIVEMNAQKTEMRVSYERCCEESAPLPDEFRSYDFAEVEGCVKILEAFVPKRNQERCRSAACRKRHDCGLYQIG